MKTSLQPIFATLLISLSGVALAHPGHGLIEGWAHFLEPDHILPALLGLGVLVFVLRRRQRQRDVAITTSKTTKAD